nr:uridine kinase [Sedimentibacter sp.]
MKNLFKQHKDCTDLFCKLETLLKTNSTINVAIEGKSGSGKSTLSDLLFDMYTCNVFHMDYFFLRPELKTEERMKEVGGNVDYVRFNEEIINGLKSGLNFKYQIYDCKQMALTEFINVKPKKLNIVEGVYSMHPTLINNYDLKVFLDIDEEKQKSRILERNGSFMYEKFINEWIPKENQYFKEMKIPEKCDIIIHV